MVARMATYTEAKANRDAAMELVTKHGGTVLQVTPREAEGGWFIEVETARPLDDQIKEGLRSHGVSVVVVDRGVPPRSERRAKRPQAGDGPSM